MRRYSKIRQNRPHGFTLVEVMVVVAIAGVLAAMGIPSIFGVYRRMTLSAEGRRLLGAFIEAQGMAVRKGTPHQLVFNRTGRNWQLLEDTNRDGTFERTLMAHPAGVDRWPQHVNFGPASGVSGAFDAPYNSVAHNTWCTPCAATATTCSLKFESDGRIYNSSDNLATGSVVLYDSVSGGTSKAQALVFVGATGNVRLYTVAQ